MTATYFDATQVYSRNFGSEKFYKRNRYNNLIYTEGMMDFQTSLNAYWVIDNIISYMPVILKAYREAEYSFLIVEIVVNQENKGYMEVYTEGYINSIYNKHITIIKQSLEYIDLPIKVDDEFTTYKLYLQLSSLEPIIFTLMLPTEY